MVGPPMAKKKRSNKPRPVRPAPTPKAAAGTPQGARAAPQGAKATPKADTAAQGAKATPQGAKATPKAATAAQGAKAAPQAAKATPKAAKAGASTDSRPRKPTKIERIEAVQREKRRRLLRKRALAGGVVALLVVVIAGVMINNRRASARLIRQLEAGSCAFDRSYDRDGGPGRNHVPGATYRVDPPAGGNHDPSAASPSLYPTAPADGQLVHAMEHGDVILWHRPDAPEADLAQLQDIANQHPTDVLVVPRPSLTGAVAATVWHRRLLCSQIEPDTLLRFVEEFKDEGPEDEPA